MRVAMKILIVEDNPRLSVRIKQQLQKWFLVELAESGDSALEKIAAYHFDLVLLDLVLPDMSGLEVCKEVRKTNSDLPILVLTGIATPESQVELLNAGADDYVAKPFNIEELKARIHALARRRLRSLSRPAISVGDLTLYPASREVIRAGLTIRLRRKEFDILEYLLTNVGRVLSREMIVNHAWPIASTTWSGSVDVHIKQLRDKVDRPFAYPLIKTSYGVGYMVEIPQPNVG